MKIFLGKSHTNEVSLWGGLLWCAFGGCLSVKIFLDKIHTHRASLWEEKQRERLLLRILDFRFWHAKLQGCHDVFSKMVFSWTCSRTTWQTHTHEAFLSGGLSWCAFGDGLSLEIYFGNSYSHVNSSATTVRCTVEWEERESWSESGFWYAKLKGFMQANIVFSFRAIKLWYSSNMWWQKFLNIRVN